MHKTRWPEAEGKTRLPITRQNHVQRHRDRREGGWACLTLGTPAGSPTDSPHPKGSFWWQNSLQAPSRPRLQMITRPYLWTMSVSCPPHHTQKILRGAFPGAPSSPPQRSVHTRGGSCLKDNHQGSEATPPSVTQSQTREASQSPQGSSRRTPRGCNLSGTVT